MLEIRVRAWLGLGFDLVISEVQLLIHTYIHTFI